MGVDLDLEMFQPNLLYANVAVANVYDLLFKHHIFDLVTASNLLFLLSDPIQAIANMKQLLVAGGRVAMLNPSENLNEQSALDFSNEKKLEGVARTTLLNWAKRAAINYHWTEYETVDLYHNAGLKYLRSELKVGPGFGRFSLGTV